MRLGPDGGLWFVSAAIPEYAAIDEASAGATGLYRLDLDSGEVTARAVLPKQDEPMVLGDLVFADDNTIYATESLTGALPNSIEMGAWAISAAFDGAHIWVTNQNSNTVSKLRASDGTTLGTFGAGRFPASRPPTQPPKSPYLPPFGSLSL